jgi:hypothetical protein
MKYTATTTIALATLLQAVHANFDLYRVGVGGNGITGNGEGWQVYEEQASCDGALDWYWAVASTVSAAMETEGALAQEKLIALISMLWK